MEKHGQKGFTLAELLLVIAILGLLASIVLVATSGATERARIAKILQWSQSLHSLLGADVVGIWRLDENPAIHNTIITDFSGKGNNGTLITNDGSTNKAVAGVVGGALSFDGTDDYVNCGTNSSLFPINAITLESWSRSDNVAARQMTVTLSTRVWLEISGYGAPTNPVTFMIKTGTVWSSVSSLTYITSNSWHHIVGTFDKDDSGNNMKIYLDGVLENSASIGSATIAYATYYCRIGNYPIADYWYFDGTIDEVRIYNRALTAVQIQKHYAEGLEKLLSNNAISEQEYHQRIIELNSSLARGE